MKTVTAIPRESLRRFHPNTTADLSLVILPHAGGSASYYYKLSEALAPIFQVLVAQYPGRQERRRDPVPPDLGTLAADIGDEIQRTVPGRFALFGHSMGAAIAYEIASRWQAGAADRLTGLFVSARVAPSVPLEIPDLDSTDRAIAELQRLGGTDARVITDAEVFDAAMAVMRTDYRLMTDYQRDTERFEDHRIDYPIHVLAPDDDARAPIDRMARWERHTSSRFALETFSGGHFYINERTAEIVDYLRASTVYAA